MPSSDRRGVLAAFVAAPFLVACGGRQAARGDDYIVVQDPSDFSLSATGSAVVLPDWRGDSHALGLCDLERKGVLILRGDPLTVLRSPRLSGDGARLAFAARRIDNGGGHIIVHSLADGSSRQFGHDGSWYRGFSFSPDGQALAAFESDVATTSPRHLVEFDLSSGARRYLSDVTFNDGFRTAYDPLGRGMLVAARGPSTNGRLASDWDNLAHDSENGMPRAFRVQAPAAGGDEARRLASAEAVGSAATFRGVTAKGEILVQSFQTDAGFRALLLDGKGVRLVHSERVPSAIPDGVEITADGGALMIVKLREGGGEVLYDLQRRELSSGRTARWTTADFRAETRQLEFG